MDVEFLKNRLQVGGDRGFADTEPIGDSFVGRTRGQCSQGFDLTSSEPQGRGSQGRGVLCIGASLLVSLLPTGCATR